MCPVDCFSRALIFSGWYEEKTNSMFPLLLHYNNQRRMLLWQNMWRYSPYTKQAINCAVDTNWVSSNSDTLYLEIVSDFKVEGSAPQDCPPLQMPIASSRWFYLCFGSTGYKLGFQWPHPLGLINLQSISQNSGKYLLIFTALLQRILQWMWIMWCIWREMGEGCEASMPSLCTPASRKFHVFSCLEVLYPHPFGILWRFHNVGMIN